MLGVCYYPEHWPESFWAEDARRMREIGIAFVRIGEFAWSRIVPSRGAFEWDWLDRAIDILGAAGLKVVLGTPTATPPKWLLDEFPDIAPVDSQGRARAFGSRRHYRFSSQDYWRESARIVEALGRRYGAHRALAGWQTDNEYGCHDTVQSWGPDDLKAFQGWLRRMYQSPTQLNEAWGNVFWSMEVRSFDEVSLPNLTVTEANPAARLDFRRFSSEQVAAYDKMQCEILRRHSPGRWITHNFMGFFNEFDHWKVGENLDFASWDSYPIGFADRFPAGGVDPVRLLAVDLAHGVAQVVVAMVAGMIREQQLIGDVPIPERHARSRLHAAGRHPQRPYGESDSCPGRLVIRSSSVMSRPCSGPRSPKACCPSRPRPEAAWCVEQP